MFLPLCSGSQSENPIGPAGECALVWPRRKGRAPAAQEERAALTRRRLFLFAFILSLSSFWYSGSLLFMFSCSG
jgi:hypothetical protein